MKDGQLKEKIIYILKSHSEEPPDDISNDNFIFLPEYGKIADEILALTEEQESTINDDQELFNKIEKAVSDYLKVIGSVDRKDCIENDFRHGISLGLSLRNQFKTK